MTLRRFHRLFIVIVCGAAAAALSAQQAPTAQQAQELYREIPGLMEATAIVVPELARAGAPLTENVKQASQALLSGPARDHAELVYTLLNNAKVYLQLVDALPKPPAFSDDLRRQVETLRFKSEQLDVYFRSLLRLRENQIRSADRDNLSRYSEANRDLLPPAATEQRVVFFGDSITDFWQLEQFFPGKPYVNRGISGQITGQMLGRMQADVIALQPAAMVLLGGTNDLARGVELQTIESNIQMICDLAAAHGIRPILAALLPVSDYHEDADPRNKRTTDRPPSDILALNAWMKSFSETRGYVYLDYHQALVDSQGMLRKDMADDGLHPNVEGYKIMGPLAEKAIAAALAASKGRDKRRGTF
jgi:lysophospholipase L1-like esterase